MHCFLVGYLVLSLWTFISLVHAETNDKDENALNVMFKSLNAPSQLSGWRLNGGDPCGNSWEGITCSGSRVTQIKLSNYGLNGELGYGLSNLTSLTSIDMSKNNLNGQIPYQLPPNVVKINLSRNQFTGDVPYSISQMTKVEDINLSNNQLDGELSDMFAKVKNLKSFDLSNNQLTGRLPNTFAYLKKLNTLHLQDNQFTGSLNAIRDLPIEDLNVENNRFTGWIPNELKGIRSLKTGGNSWSTGKAPPPPPGVVHRHPKPDEEEEEDNDDGGKKKSKLVRNIIIIAASCFGVLLLVAGLCAAMTSRRKSSPPSSQFADEEKNAGQKGTTPFQSNELTAAPFVGTVKESKGLKTIESGVIFDPPPPEYPLAVELKHSGSVSGRPSSVTEPVRLLKARGSTSASVVAFSLPDLQNATGNFAPSHLLGEGNIGRVYRAKCVDDKVLAVKKIDSALLQGEKPEGFSEIVENISKLHHPNIAELVGYCSEQGQYLLVYDHYRNGSIHEFLHVSDDFSKPLTWNTRLSIALGAARAVEYLHKVCSPPIVHKNIKSSNILLDAKLNPHLSDYGMAHFHERTSQNLGMGYNAPECISPSAYTLKSDVYSFGVVMLELLTGRKPLDNKKPRSEQCLVKWASPQLHDTEALAVMVDPALRGLYPPKSLPPFAEIIALCVKSDPKLRPTMSEVVQSLVQLVQQSNRNMRDELSTSRQEEDEECSVIV
ncbi:Protein STRUBBELIG-RECEPTOR FAMILY 5 [Hibiscus syriacus]|uniref:Protein STRUBBELIG-RECEPTOR FAMILY 5 n=1 Tax=Hibiscus syriacus TaxID=106335 RepID=A0A6A2XEL2_HIBSY|nr:protein STRUBBELIG-RECEPTOR FAMILY 4-like [Hibiscus syriacus]KAE8656909.1 Protein STRUBBELIG-RECEPTOR FAMILY 5 [Hibiscus syriacus]